MGDIINNLNIGLGVASGFVILNPFLGIAIADLNNQKNEANNYLNNIDILTNYDKLLQANQSSQLEYKGDILSIKKDLSDLEYSKSQADEYLEDYRQMLAGSGDSDNLLLQQDRINKQNIANARADLAAYKDSSALELDSFITSAFSEYTNARNAEAIYNIYAGAVGTVLGTYNSAAKRTQAAIRAFVGDDMKFNEEPQGTAIRGNTEMIGSYAKMMLSNRQLIKNNIAKLNTQINAAKLAYDSFRDQAADYAHENENFLSFYDETKSLYDETLENLESSLGNLQEEAEGILQDAEKVVEDVHNYEDKKGFEQSDWGWGPSEETKNKQQAAWNYIKENIVDPISSAIKEYQSNK